jgi:hypothetical protein
METEDDQKIENEKKVENNGAGGGRREQQEEERMLGKTETGDGEGEEMWKMTGILRWRRKKKEEERH